MVLRCASFGACGGQAGTMLLEGQGAQTEVCATQDKMQLEGKEHRLKSVPLKTRCS